MKQTAVEWLLEELDNGRHLTDELINKAKEIEKQQIIDACNAGLSGIPRNAEQYYNETFNLSKQDKP
jgi:hypothetical protein